MAGSGMEHALHPVFVLSGLFGVAPITHGQWRTGLYSLYSLLVLVVLVSSTLYSMVYLYNMNQDLYTSILRLSLDRFQFLLNSSTAAMSIVCTFLARKQSKLVLQDLEAVDDLLWKSGTQVSYDMRHYLFGTLFRLCLVSVGVIMEHLFVVRIDSLNRFVLYTCEFLPMFIAQLIEYQHNAILSTVQRRFSCLIEKILSLKGRHLCVGKQSELESLVKIYNCLLESCGIINDIYGKQILFIVGHIFVITTTNADYVVEGIIEMMLGRCTKEPEVLFCFGYWAVLRLLELWSVIKICEAVVMEAKEFSSSLYQFIIEENVETSKNKKIRLHLTVQKEPYFSAHGFFALDFSLLHSIIAAGTTYLVILVQFSQTSTNSSRRSALSNATKGEEPVFGLFEDIDYSNSTI